jgi:hypothetical protein
MKGHIFLLAAIACFTTCLFVISSVVGIINAKDYYIEYKKEELKKNTETLMIMRNKYDGETFLELVRIIGRDIVITNGRYPIFNNVNNTDIYNCIIDNNLVYISDIIKCGDIRYIVFTKRINTETVILITEYKFNLLEIIKLSIFEIILTSILIFSIMLLFTWSVTQMFIVPLDRLSCFIRHGKNEKYNTIEFIEEIKIIIDHINTTNDANNKLRQMLIQSNILSIERNNLLNAALKTELLKK